MKDTTNNRHWKNVLIKIEHDKISLLFLKSLLTLLSSLSSCSNDHENDDDKHNTSENYNSYKGFKIPSVKHKCVLYFHHNRCFKKIILYIDIVPINFSDPASYLWQNLLATSNIKIQFLIAPVIVCKSDKDLSAVYRVYNVLSKEKNTSSRDQILINDSGVKYKVFILLMCHQRSVCTKRYK